MYYVKKVITEVVLLWSHLRLSICNMCKKKMSGRISKKLTLLLESPEISMVKEAYFLIYILLVFELLLSSTFHLKWIK